MGCWVCVAVVGGCTSGAALAGMVVKLPWVAGWCWLGCCVLLVVGGVVLGILGGACLVWCIKDWFRFSVV